MSAQPGPPYFLFVDGPCEGDCIFCSRKKDAETPFERLAERLDLKAPGSLLAIVGNDPLLHSRIIDIVSACRGNGFPGVEIMTSGIRLQDRAFAERLIAAGAGSFSIPLHAASAARHDAITRTPGSFLAAIRGIANVLRSGARVFVHATLVRQNFREIPALSVFVREKLRLPFAILPVRPKFSGLAFSDLTVPLSDVRALQGFGLYGFPRCVSPKDTGIPSESMKGYFKCQLMEKPGKCFSCAMSRECPGLFRDYIDLFGDRELNPYANEATA